MQIRTGTALALCYTGRKSSVWAYALLRADLLEKVYVVIFDKSPVGYGPKYRAC